MRVHVCRLDVNTWVNLYTQTEYPLPETRGTEAFHILVFFRYWNISCFTH